jgi:tripartite-type tricarboxylate transporter receptor subunit TctC
MAMLPDVPTMAEAGLPNAEAVASFSMVAPAGTPQAAIDRLQTAVAKALARPDVRERLASLGAEPVGSSPAELGKFMHEEMGTWGAIVKSLNISVE